MGGDLGGDHAFPDIVHVREREVLSRRYVTQKISPRHSGQGPANGPGDVVVPGADVGDQRPENVKRRAVAQSFLQHDVSLHLVKGNVPGAFDHHLYAGFPCPEGQLAQRDELFELGGVSGVGQAAGPQAVTKTDGDVVFFENLEDLVVSGIEGGFPGFPSPSRWRGGILPG